MIDRFYGRVRETVAPLQPASVLDAGCGEGETLERLRDLLPERVAAVDLSEPAARFTAARIPEAEVSVHSVDALPFPDRSFDLVLCLEVLEHLEDPGAALDELARVARRDLVLSTPHEPWFRLGSLARGKYLRGLGNHPEHVNHWGPRRLAALLETRFSQVELWRSFPWLIARCRR